MSTIVFNSNPGHQEYLPVNSTSSVTFNFKVYQQSDIRIFIEDVADVSQSVEIFSGTDFTLTIDGDVGGQVNFTPSIVGGSKITLWRTLTLDRYAEFVTNGDLLADTLNSDQNYQTYMIGDNTLLLSKTLQEYIRRDGTIAMTDQLTLVPTPVADTDATSKIYVDTEVANIVKDVVYSIQENGVGDTTDNILVVTKPQYDAMTIDPNTLYHITAI